MVFSTVTGWLGKEAGFKGRTMLVAPAQNATKACTMLVPKLVQGRPHGFRLVQAVFKACPRLV